MISAYIIWIKITKKNSASCSIICGNTSFGVALLPISGLCNDAFQSAVLSVPLVPGTLNEQVQTGPSGAPKSKDQIRD